MIAAAFISLGLVHLGIWSRQPRQHVRLAFFAVAISVALLTISELMMMRATTPEAFGVVQRWGQVPLFTAVISTVVFARLYLRAGRLWLACGVCALALLALILNFYFEPNLRYQQIIGLNQLAFLGGEITSVAFGVSREWFRISELSLLLLLAFVIEAAVTCWSRGTSGERRRAVSVGGSFVLVALVCFGNEWLIHTGAIEPIRLTSVALLPVFIAMSYELGADMAHAEVEIRQLRTELAHLSRVTMLGELSGSLAHELNQPLAAVLSNAQAAQRFLANDEFNLIEMREILQDIVDDNKRAGEVIRGLRLLLMKGVVQHQPLDLNDVVRDVLRLVRSDTLNSGIRVEVELAKGLPNVVGDRVQLQQVLLNLVVNGCEAMGGAAAADRQLNVSTAMDARGSVRVTVSDRGHGIAPENLERVFEPFFTSKSEGLGLGLAVSRTIISAQGGLLWGNNNAVRGASFHFTVPACREPMATGHA